MRPSTDFPARTTRLLTCLLSTLAALCPGAPLLAADGDLDPSFWTDGKIYFGTTGSHHVARVLEAPDGRVVVVGTRPDPVEGTSGWFWRSIGDAATGPTCSFFPPGNADSGAAHTAAFDDSGRLVVAGSARYGSVRAAVARFDYPDCALDDSFDGDGFYTLDVPGGTEELTAIALSGNGRITLGGIHFEDTNSDVLVIQLTASGQPVTQFSENGWLTFDVTGAELYDAAYSIAVDAQQRIVVGGTTYYDSASTNGDFVALRFTASGTPDATFDDDGIARVAFDLGGSSQRMDQASALAIDPKTGAIVLAGYAETIGTFDLAVVRLTPAGALDPTFSGDGKLNQNFGLSQVLLFALVVDGLGRVSVAGEAMAFSGTSGRDFFTARFTESGAVDTTFSGNGWVKVPFDLGGGTFVDDHGSTATFASGRLVAAGRVTRNSANEKSYGILRLQNDLIFADGFDLGFTRAWSETLDGNPQ